MSIKRFSLTRIFTVLFGAVQLFGIIWSVVRIYAPVTFTPTFVYYRPGGTDQYLQPDGTSIYYRPV